MQYDVQPGALVGASVADLLWLGSHHHPVGPSVLSRDGGSQAQEHVGRRWLVQRADCVQREQQTQQHLTLAAHQALHHSLRSTTCASLQALRSYRSCCGITGISGRMRALPVAGRQQGTWPCLQSSQVVHGPACCQSKCRRRPLPVPRAARTGVHYISSWLMDLLTRIQGSERQWLVCRLDSAPAGRECTAATGASTAVDAWHRVGSVHWP